MALELNGTTGVSLVQDGVVTAADLASTLDLTGKTVTLPSGTGGKVLQVVNGLHTTETSIASSSWTDTGLTASITPSSASNKILIAVSHGVMSRIGTAAPGDLMAQVRLVRNSTSIQIITDVDFFRFVYSTQSSGSGYMSVPGVHTLYLDSPATTSSTTYKTQAYTVSGVNGIRFGTGDATDSIVLMEIAA